MTPIHIAAGLGALLGGGFIGLGLKSQKGKAPGLVDGQLAEGKASPNWVSSEPGTQPERYVRPLMATMDQAAAAIEAMGGTITTRSEDYVSATFMSRTFKFVDDVELRDGGEAGVHIRSGSRVGFSDQGANRRRVETLRKHIEKTVTALP